MTEEAFRTALYEIIRQCSYLPLRGHDPALSAARREIETAASSALRALGHEDLLTAAERERLRADLAEMARLRRKAMDAARDWPMP